MLYKTSI